jgi:hypothetical protein
MTMIKSVIRKMNLPALILSSAFQLHKDAMASINVTTVPMSTYARIDQVLRFERLLWRFLVVFFLK